MVSRFKNTAEEFTLPPRPKRPLTVYAQYVQSTYKQLQQGNPTIRTQDIMKKISEKWADVDRDVKLKMQTQYMEQYNIYKQQLKEYNNSLTIEQKRLANKASKKNVRVKIKSNK